MIRTYRVFTRNWWKPNPEWPYGREPDASGSKRTIERGCSFQQAKAICKDWNDRHDPGHLSRKAEFEEE